ncbi:unnamed protein product, partial [Tilletia laevis]
MTSTASTSASAAEADPYATIRSSHSNRKAPSSRTPILPATSASPPSFSAPRTSTPNTSSSSCSPLIRPSSPTPSTFSASSSSHSSTTSSFKRRRTSVDSVTTDWTGSLPRTNFRAKTGSRLLRHGLHSNRDSLGSSTSAPPAEAEPDADADVDAEGEGDGLKGSAESTTSSTATTQSAQAAFEELFHATAFALERSNELLLSTLNSRSQLASLRAQQSAIEQNMNSRELELRRRLEANRDMAEWVRQSAEQLETLVRELDAERLRAAGGKPVLNSTAGAGGGGAGSAWGFARPAHWRVPSLGGLGSVFGAAGENEAAGSVPNSAAAAAAAATTSSLSSEANVGNTAEDGTLTIGKTAAKRLERVLIKHKRGQSSLSLASSMQGQQGHGRSASVASSRLETPIFLNGGGGGGNGAGVGDMKLSSPSHSPLAKMVDFQDEARDTGADNDKAAPPSKEDSELHAANTSSSVVSTLAPSSSSNIPATPKSTIVRSRSSKLIRPGKPGLGLRLGPSAPTTTTTPTAALSSPTVVVSRSAETSSSPEVGGVAARNSFASRRTESHTSLSSINEDEGNSLSTTGGRTGRLFSFGAGDGGGGAGPATSSAAPASPTVDRCVSPALSIQFTPGAAGGGGGGARRTPSQRGSISSLNSVNSVRSERYLNMKTSGGMSSPGFAKPRALVAVAGSSAPASRLEVPTTVLSGSAPFPGWSSGPADGLPDMTAAAGAGGMGSLMLMNAGGGGGGGASGTLSALLSRSPSRAASATSAQRSTAGSEMGEGEGEGEEDDSAQFSAYLRNSENKDSSTSSDQQQQQQQQQPKIPPASPLKVDARR